jgi:hypothetical protein
LDCAGRISRQIKAENYFLNAMFIKQNSLMILGLSDNGICPDDVAFVQCPVDNISIKKYGVVFRGIIVNEKGVIDLAGD